jgi:hypothetical protein
VGVVEIGKLLCHPETTALKVYALRSFLDWAHTSAPHTNLWRLRMAISEQARFEMNLGLRKALGDTVASSLMEHLPPHGWGDVARKGDIDFVQIQLNLVDKQLNKLAGAFRVLIGVSISVSVAILVMLIQVNQNLSGL